MAWGQEGIREAQVMEEREGKAAAAQQQAAERGMRAGLSWEAVGQAEAAQLLLTARQMLCEDPRLEAARCSEVEVS